MLIASNQKEESISIQRVIQIYQFCITYLDVPGLSSILQDCSSSGAWVVEHVTIDKLVRTHVTKVTSMFIFVIVETCKHNF